MGPIPGNMIKRLVAEKKLLIEPFHEDGIQPASYDARLGYKILAGPILDERGRSMDLREEKKNEYAIETGQFVSVMTEEKFTFPNDICGRFGLKSFYTRMGLISFGGIQIDPGWRGHLVISLTNVGPEPIKLEMGKKMFTIEFHRLESPTEFPYSGEYQDQYDFPEEDRKYVVEAETQTLAKIPMLEAKVTTMSRTLSEISKMVGLDPFNIPLDEFDRLPFDEWKTLANRAYELCVDEIKKAFKEAEFVVVCDWNVVLTTNDPPKVSGEEIVKFAKKLGKPCYTFSRPLIIEEVTWSVVRERDEDYYPTVQMLIGTSSWDTKELIKRGKNMVADFDTGNPYRYLILDQKVGEGIVSPPTRNEIITGQHIGRFYNYFWRIVLAGIRDIKRSFKSRELFTQLVLNWNDSPFVEASPHREGFTGRCLMFDFNFRITLDPKLRTSTIEYIR